MFFNKSLLFIFMLISFFPSLLVSEIYCYKHYHEVTYTNLPYPNSAIVALKPVSVFSLTSSDQKTYPELRLNKGK